MRYKVILKESNYTKYEVEANSEEEAIDLIGEQKDDVSCYDSWRADDEADVTVTRIS